MQETIRIKTQGRSMVDITAEVEKFISQSNVETGLCNLFIQHTSASLILCENADSDVRSDLENFMQQLVRDGDPLFRHRAEGPDDMPAHIRSVLTSSSLTIPIAKGRCLLGAWQGIYLWEHRFNVHTRNIIVTIQRD
ncbi:MAG: YjbQ family protein [Gammaproteobacteria bacterium]|nr:MAG: YjbQ family protein [Gammaproteobacteria bacterium]